MTDRDKLVSAPKARREYLGGISAMTEWRWIQAGILPRPVKINGRNFHYESDLVAVPQRAAEIEMQKQKVKSERGIL